MRRHIWRWVLLTAAAAMVALPCTHIAHADDSQATTITVTTAVPQAEGQSYSVGARITTAAGKPVNGVTLTFYVMADLFGEHPMLIGKETTDGQGRATVKYVPSWKGQHDVVVKFAGSGGFAASEGKGSFVSTVAIAPHENERLPLAGFSEKVPYAVGVIVLGVWAAIVFALVSSVRAALGGGAHIPAREAAGTEPAAEEVL
jgi:hypothetical protein